VVPTDVQVHFTPLYEALTAVVIAAPLWALGRRWNPPAVLGAYLALSGISGSSSSSFASTNLLCWG
jgi:hypothetical protein